jgi:hypothetical protein
VDADFVVVFLTVAVEALDVAAVGFFDTAFFDAAFLAGVFLDAVFFGDAFLAAVFLAEALVADFLDDAFFTPAPDVVFVTACFLAAALDEEPDLVVAPFLEAPDAFLDGATVCSRCLFVGFAWSPRANAFWQSRCTRPQSDGGLAW